MSWAALNRCHSASSTSLAARPAAFHSVSRSRNVGRGGAPVGGVGQLPRRARTAPPWPGRAPTRSRSSSAKCEPRRRLNVSRAAEYRFHSASSILRSSPVIVRHSSRISRSRSPAAFHWVAWRRSSSASAASASLRAVCAARCSSRFWRSLGGSRVGLLDDGAEPGRQRVDVTEHRGGRQGFGQRGGGRLDLAGVAGAGGRAGAPAARPRCAGRRSGDRSGRRRPRRRRPARSRLTRSPSAVISHTVPSSSTRPNRCGSRGRRERPRRPGGAWSRGGARTVLAGVRARVRAWVLRLVRWSSCLVLLRLRVG